MSLADDGRLHKAINVNNKMHIIEEIMLFTDPQPVQHIELDSEKVQYRERNLFIFGACPHSGSNNELTKCQHWQFRGLMSCEESRSLKGSSAHVH